MSILQDSLYHRIIILGKSHQLQTIQIRDKCLFPTRQILSPQGTRQSPHSLKSRYRLLIDQKLANRSKDLRIDFNKIRIVCKEVSIQIKDLQRVKKSKYSSRLVASPITIRSKRNDPKNNPIPIRTNP
jgi:hypothetical protein